MGPAPNRRHALAAATALAALIHGAAASAQQAPDPATAPAAGRVDEVVVTARRREELLQDVPVAVTAYSGQQLTQLGVTRVADLALVTPGLQAQASPFGNSALTLSLRGQRQGLANIAYDPAIPVYFDEVVQARSQGLNASMFDLESVQVLKGPQGTLFGRNSNGGALLITSKPPSHEFEGYLRGTLGDYNLREGEGAVNLPLGDMFALRAGAIVSKRDGYTKNYNPQTGFDLDNADISAWRLSLAFEPNKQFSNQLVLNGFSESDGGVAYKLIYARPGSPAAVDAAELAFYQAHDFHTSNVFSPRDGTRIKTTGFENITKYEVNDALTIKNILGNRVVKSIIYFDLDGVARTGTASRENVKEHQWSDELQALGTAFDGRLAYAAGIYGFDEKGHEYQTVEIAGAGLNNTITDNQVESKSVAIYAQGTYKLPWVEGLSLTAGVRYTWDTRDLTSRNRFFSGVCRIVDADVNGAPLNPCIKSVSADFSEPTYTASLDWKIRPTLLTYFTYRRGYQGGGFTNSANRPSEFTPFLPQTVNDFELGLKADWHVADMPVRTNIAAYYDEYDNIQRLTSFPAFNPSGLAFTQNRILNAASSTVKGVELEAQIRPLPELLLSVSYAYTDAAYDKYIINGLDFAGAPFAGTPQNSVGGMIRWDLPYFQFANVAAQLDGSWQDWTVVSDATSYNAVTRTVIPLSVLPSWGVLNAHLEFNRIGGRPVNLTLWVRNLTDEDYYTAGIDSSTTAGGNSVRLLGAPRTFGADLRVDF